MKTRLLSVGLSLFVVLGAWGNRLPAQAPTVEVAPFEHIPPPMYSPAPVYGPQVFVAPEIPWVPDRHPPYVAGIVTQPSPAPARFFFRRALNHCGVGCQANLDGNVGNFYSEASFIFSSSRTFFNETCVPNQHFQPR